MQQTARILLQVIFFLQVLLLFLFLFGDRLSLPVWLEVAGRFHPAVLHLPIGAFCLGLVLAFLESHFKKKSFRKISLAALVFTSVSCSVTALLGIFLAQQGDYGAEALTQHKNSGVFLSFLCYFLLVTFTYGRKEPILYYVLGILSAGTLVYVGHTGSVLTHGENFLLAPLKQATGPVDANASAFQQVIYPVLERKCASCHNRTKAKGKFVMTSMEEFKKGGKHGVEWVAGSPSESRMIQYIHLPLSDDDHMPPDGKPQLSANEIKLLEAWIAAGADMDKKLDELADQDSFKIMGKAFLAVANVASREEKVYEFSAASEETIQKMNTPFRSVFPLYQKSPALQADFFVRESFKPSSLEELKEIKDQLVVLNLSKMPVTDDDLKVIAAFSNLEKLNLNFSKISGSGLSALLGLKHLQYLSLAGTAVTAETVAPVVAIPSLRELYVWNTKITEEDRVKLSAGYPSLSVYTTQFKDDQVLRLSKPFLANEEIVKRGERVELRHSMPGVTIRYTLDGSNPDSVTSSTFESPLAIPSTSVLKAIACKPGWYCSELFETTCFVQGIKPASAHLVTNPDKQYRGEGDKSLVDERKGFIESFKDAAWLGYQNDPFVAGFEFGPEPPVLHSIVISYGKNVGSHIMPPEAVEVWAGKNSKQVSLIQSMKIQQPTGYDPAQLVALMIPLKDAHYGYYKIIAKPVGKLPPWHSAKGKKGWIFVDEVFFY